MAPAHAHCVDTKPASPIDWRVRAETTAAANVHNPTKNEGYEAGTVPEWTLCLILSQGVPNMWREYQTLDSMYTPAAEANTSIVVGWAGVGWGERGV